MKSIFAATIVMLMLASPAFGFGNSAFQSNIQEASGNGIGTIEQKASNVGLIICDFNHVMQLNKQDATLNAASSSIEQISANNVLVAAVGSWVKQRNLATASTFEYGNRIKQTQENFGLIIDCCNCPEEDPR